MEKIVFALLTMTICSFGVAVAQAQPEPILPAQSAIAARCAQEDNNQCRGACLDGFGTDCYFVKGEAPDDAGPANYRKFCFGYRHHSVCTPCANDFMLRKEGKLEAVSCQKFYEGLLEKNKDCGSCLDKTFSYGG